MKKRLAVVMAALLAVQSPLQAAGSGGAILSYVPDGYGGREASPSDAQQVLVGEIDSYRSDGKAAEGSGTLRLEIQGVTEGKESSWTVELHSKDSEREVIRGDIVLPVMENNQYSLTQWSQEEIPDGQYDLLMFPSELEENSYIPYEQENIRINSDVTTLHLMNDLPESHGYGDSEDSAKIGVLAMGDINGDGEVDDQDKEELLKLVASEEKHDDAFTGRADLNGDGEVDLLDVVHFTKYYKTGAEERQAVPVKSILVKPFDINSATSSNAAPVEGSVAGVFAGVEPVKLEAEGAISEANPVELEAEFAVPKTMEGFVIEPVTGSPGSIQDGTVIVTDADGKELIFQIVNGQVQTRKSRSSVAMSAAAVMAAERMSVAEVTQAAERKTKTAESGTEAETAKSKIKAAGSWEEAETAENRIEAEAAKSKEEVESKSEVPAEIQEMIAETKQRAESESTEEDTMLQGVPIAISLGGQVAVKRVTIKVSRTLASTNLVEISKVEFLNHMEDRIPEPQMSVPDRLEVANGDASFTVSWRKQPNVTGYEVTVTGINSKKAELSQTFQVGNATTFTVDGLGEGKLVNGREYVVLVCSVNGSWRSRSSSVTAHPRAMKLPPAPENISIIGGYKRLAISWKEMDDTDTYTLYYRKADEEGGEYQSIPDIAENRYNLLDLEDQTKYEIYLTGVNPLGEGPASVSYTGATVSVEPPKTPDYKLINTLVEPGKPTAHVESVMYGGTEDHEFDVVDGDYTTSWVREDWDAGFHYPGENKSPIVTLDAEYQMDTIVLVPDEQQTFGLAGARIDYWDAQGTKKSVTANLSAKTSNDKTYYMVQAREPFTAKRVQLAVTTGYNRRISIAELKFYYFDPIEQDIMGLYADNYHVSLREDVTQAEIDELRRRLNTVDEVSKEYHPKLESLEAELVNAEKILREGSPDDEILKVDNKDTEKSDSHISFRSGLNVYQPLGVTAMAGETITVYAGGPNHRVGDGTRLELIASQYYGSSNAVFKSLGYLKAGANEITISALDDMDLERGGQLYIAYTGSSGAEEYGVRVMGGTRIPTLDVTDAADETQRMDQILSYIDALDTMEAKAERLHQEHHKDYEWNPRLCIYEGTDIVTRYVMLSLPVRQVLEGLGNGSRQERAERLDQAMQSLDEMMYLFYQHKGLSEDPEAPEYNKMPVSRINIRYQRMFAGAFMYAGGRHIGIEWPESTGMVNCDPVQADENGKYISGRYFGWGIAHEIGHEINEGAYAVAEVTNNYFSVLAQAKDTNDSVRFKYPDVFQKVTSGTKGKASNVFVRLAMYWQLHLAYDRDGYNYKTYDSNAEQLNNLFFARVDSYVRKPDTAPGNLQLNGADSDNKLMRLAVAAANKDILEFFRRWGLEPDEETIAYASQFEKETRGIWFSNDEARVYQMEHGLDENLSKDLTVTGDLDYTEGSNTVTLNLTALSSPETIWIYEIYRYERVKDQIERKPVGYAQAENGQAVFTDVIGTINNHTFTYEAVGYDLWMNPTEKAEIGSVKVCHRGDIDRSLWTVTTNMTNDQLQDGYEEDPDVKTQPGVEVMIDEELSTSFTGRTESKENPEVILHLNQEETITGLEYMAAEGTPIEAFSIYVSQTGGEEADEWTKVKTRESVFELTDGTQTIYFTDGKNLYTYDASYVKLVAEGQGGQDLTISDLSLLGQTGDNVVLEEADHIGLLSEAYIENGQELIPAGSLIITGTYKGNPAYNTVLLWDEDGNVVGGTDQEGNINAHQIIFAPDPENGMLGEVSDGIWVYYIEPGFDTSQIRSKQIRAELYRVDDPLTQEGERLVSSTLFVEVPSELPSIKLNAGGQLDEK